MTKVYRPLRTPLGLTCPRCMVMLTLRPHGEITAGAPGTQVTLDSAPLVRQLTGSAIKASGRD